MTEETNHVNGKQPKLLCSIDDCRNSAFSRGICKKHYQQHWKAGSVSHFKMSRVIYSDADKCAIEGCERRPYGHGKCEPHYKNKGRDPHAPIRKQADRGALLKWLQECVPTATAEDCLIWPFHCDAAGYAGKVQCGSRRMFAHQWALEWRVGLRPGKNYQTLHGCGNGHLGCVNPHHLRWGTQSENSADMIAHGRSTRGEKNPASKLTNLQVVEIKRLLSKQRMSSYRIAERYGVSERAVDSIKSGECWNWISGTNVEQSETENAP